MFDACVDENVELNELNDKEVDLPTMFYAPGSGEPHEYQKLTSPFHRDQ